MASAPKLRPLSKVEDIKAIPLDQPVLIELPAAVSNAEPAPRTDASTGQQDQQQADPVKTLQGQLEAMREANKLRDAETARITRERDDARAAAQQAERDRAEAGKQAVTSGLAQAQADIAAAKQAYRIASEAGDYAAAADAQEKIGRASATILHYEREGATAGERETQTRRETVQQQPDVMANMEASPNLLPKEKEFFRAHPEALIDAQQNKRLDVAYGDAMARGLVRGTPAYFEFIEERLGYRQASQQRQDDETGQNEEEVMGAAPVSRQNGTLNGAPARSDQIILTPEQREICANMGISEVAYAQQIVRMRQDKKDNPERYFQPGNR